MAGEAAKISWMVIWPIIWITVGGFFISLILFFVGLPGVAGGCFPEGASWWSGLLGCLWILVYAAVFLVAYPIGYFILGKQFGVNRGIAYVLAKRQEFIWRYLFKKMFLRFEKKGLVKDGETSGGDHFLKASRKFLKELPGVPWGFRHILKAVLWLLPFNEALEESFQESQQRTMTSEELAEMMAPKMARAATELMYEADFIFLGIALGVQVLIVVLLRVL